MSTPIANTGFVPGSNCLEVHEADRFAVIVDADDYFSIARRAMLGAKRRITLIGWDFDARIAIGDPSVDGGPETLGDFIYWLVERNPELEIFLLRWDVGALKSVFRGTTLLSLFKWMAHPRIHTKLDRHHPTASSHHQKIVVIDEALAFVGGIDMVSGRWDTREHRFADERRKHPGSNKPYKPWHDATSAMTGPVVDTILSVCRERWDDAGGKPPMTPLSGTAAIWPEGLWTHFQTMPVAISRSAPEMDDRKGIHEIEKLYLDQIAGAQRIVYAESQYFASRRIAEAIAKRLQEPDGPEFVIVNPETAEGWLEPIAMDTARARLVETLRRLDTHGRFRLYHPVNAGGEAIYVHAKILLVDDQILRIGSSNMNNRSMRLDTECDVSVMARSPDESKVIADLRNDLVAEHLGCNPGLVAERLSNSGSLIQTIEHLRGDGRTLKPYETPDLSGVEAWLAENEVLDPEGPAEMFELQNRKSLFRGLRDRLRSHHNN